MEEQNHEKEAQEFIDAYMRSVLNEEPVEDFWAEYETEEEE